jgi:hypothetical protein
MVSGWVEAGAQDCPPQQFSVRNATSALMLSKSTV